MTPNFLQRSNKALSLTERREVKTIEEKRLYQALIHNLGKSYQSGAVSPYVVKGEELWEPAGQEKLEGYRVLETSKGKFFVEASASRGSGKKETFQVDGPDADFESSFEYWSASEEKPIRLVRRALKIPAPPSRHFGRRF